MRAILLILVVCFVINEPAFAQARFPFTAEASADRVHVRAGQHNNYDSVAVLQKGALVTVLGKEYSWFRIALPEGAKAYVKASYVKVLSQELGEVVVDKLNVRAAPDAESVSLGQLKRGQRFFIRSTEKEWIWLQQPLDGVSGWVQESFLKFKADGALKGALDPNDAAAQKEAEARLREEKEAAKTALLNKNADGSVECTGTLLKREGGPTPYRIVRDKALVCFVEGPQSVLDSFVDSRVRMTGQVKSVPADADAAIVGLSRIKLDI